MDFENDEKIVATILYHLRRKKVIGGVHMSFDTLRRGFPSHLGKEVEKCAKKMIRDGLLVIKPTNYGLQVSLNKDRIVEIDNFIKKVLGFTF